MNNIQTELQNIFDNNWKPMRDLLREARSIEFAIRMVSELNSNYEFTSGRTWQDFNFVDSKIKRDDIDNHIRDIWNVNPEKMLLIKQIVDKLAHADYLGARNRILAYSKKFNIQTILSNDPVNILKINNMTFEDGSKGTIEYNLQSNKENTTLEEFQIFNKQGYVSALKEIFDEAKMEINKIVPDLGMKTSGLVIARGLKYGKKIPAK